MKARGKSIVNGLLTYENSDTRIILRTIDSGQAAYLLMGTFTSRAFIMSVVLTLSASAS